MMTELGRSRYQPDALDVPPAGDALLVRLAGPAEALAFMAEEILAHWPGVRLSATEADALWKGLSSLAWSAPDGVLMKVSLAPAHVPSIVAAVGSAGGLVHISSGGNVLFVSFPSPESAQGFAPALAKAGLTAMTLRGSAPLWLGAPRRTEISRAVKAALDPINRFPPLEDY
jgi:hypothetical protein